MNIIHITFPNEIPTNIDPIVLAIGFFDGIHLGHQEVIATAKAKATEKGIPCAVMTFFPHPREVLGKQSHPYSLTPRNEKMKLMEEMGVDTVYMVHFDKTFASVLPKQFIDEVLMSLNVNVVVVGFNYTFGHKGSGTVHHLSEYSEGRYSLEVVGPITVEGEQVSSTLTREKLLNGEIETVAKLLGRPYRITGEVIHGEGRGRTIGFATANLNLPEPYFVPKTGVYAVRVEVEGRWFDGVMNIGYKPTFHDNMTVPSFEVHLLDEARDLYGSQMVIEFVSYLRSEKKFENVGQLVDQIALDCQAARDILAEWKMK